MNKESLHKYFPAKANVDFGHNTALFEVSTDDLSGVINDLYFKHNLPLALVTATDERKENGCFKIWYIFGVPKENVFVVPYIQLKNTEEFPSITPLLHQALNYERKINSFFGLTPVGHPDLRPIILHENWPTDIFPLRKDFGWEIRPKEAHSDYEFQRIDGEGIYEIPVGPIHAGIIEPGHFRFSVAGEEIMNLEARLGFVHKGSEKLFEVLSLNDKVRLSEKISGDSSFSHSMAFCQALEQLSDTAPTKRAKYLRVIFAELERLANHLGDIGAIMTDTGFNFGGANGARLREMIMQINEELTGSRFLRGVNSIGGVTKDIVEKKQLLDELKAITKDFKEVIAVAENSASLFNRLNNTGRITREIAKDHGVTGVAAKAVGIPDDARMDFPYAAYDEVDMVKIEVETKGDVCARFYVRIKEVYSSMEIIQNALHELPEGAIKTHFSGTFKRNAVAINIVEGWRGQIVYFVTTDASGNISRVTPNDPSFMNWSVLGRAGLTNIVPDFPLINKSFNLSYSGNDL